MHLAIKQDLYGPEWKDGHGDYWNSPQFRVENALELADLDMNPETGDEYKDLEIAIEEQRLNIIDILLAYPGTNVATQSFIGMTSLRSIRYET